MRKFIAIFLAILLSIGLFAGEWQRNAVDSDMGEDKKVYFECTVDTLDTLESNQFTITEFNDADWSTNGVQYLRNMTSPILKPRVTVEILGTNDNQDWAVVDTLFKDDSLQTVDYMESDLNNTKAHQYKMRIINEDTGPSGTDVKIIFYFYRQD